MDRNYYQYFSYLNGRTVFLSHHSAKDVKVSDLAPLTITATVTALPPDYDRMKRQLATAERLYAAATDGLVWLVAQEWDVSLSAIVALEKALEDYANAKGEK